MADAQKLRQQAERGDRARQILEDPLVVDAFAVLEKQMFDLWRETKAHEEEDRERIYWQAAAYQNFKEILLLAMTNGEVAKKQLLGQTESGLRRLLGG